MSVTPHLETTPRAYYKHYVTATPSYDLYPGLSRRLGNGYVHQPSPPVRRQTKDTNFINMNLHQKSPLSSRPGHQQQQRFVSPQENNHPSWDLYPSILRSVENFGTDQMRRELHAMETTTM